MQKEDRRQHKREVSQAAIRLYTNASRGVYTVQLRDITVAGAFAVSNLIPKKGETVTWVILNEDGKEIHKGDARVMWTKSLLRDKQKGFGLRFNKNIDETILNYLKITNDLSWSDSPRTYFNKPSVLRQLYPELIS